MKKLNYVFILSIMIMLLVGCSKTDDFWGDEPLGNTLKKGHAELKTVTVPLKADFTVWNESGIPDESCAPDYVLRLTMVGNGNMSHLGKMTTRMEFCANPVAVGPYGNGFGKFVAANGDELYFNIEGGEIFVNEEDNANYYLTKFNDKIVFTGGTGRFDGATGYFWSNAYVHYPDPSNVDDEWHTDFFSYGILILVKGKR